MKRKKQFQFVLAGCLLLASTSSFLHASNPENATEKFKAPPLIECKLSKVGPEQEIKLSELITDFKIINIEDRDDALFGNNFPTVSDKFMGVIQYQKDYLLFDHNGNLVCKVGRSGQGPGEYVSLSESLIDGTDGKLYLVPFSGKQKLMEYNMDGAFVRDINIPINDLKKPKVIQQPNGDFIIFQLPFESDPDPVLVLQCDKDGKLKNKCAPSKSMIVNPRDKDGNYVGFNNEIILPRNTGEYNFMISTSDTLYNYDPSFNKVSPILALDCGSTRSSIPYIYMTDMPTHYFVFIPSKGVVGIDKKSKKQSYAMIKNDFAGGMEVPLWSFNNGWYCQAFEPMDLSDKIDGWIATGKCTEAEKKQLEKMKASLDPNGTNVVFIGKIKQ